MYRGDSWSSRERVCSVILIVFLWRPAERRTTPRRLHGSGLKGETLIPYCDLWPLQQREEAPLPDCSSLPDFLSSWPLIGRSPAATFQRWFREEVMSSSVPWLCCCSRRRFPTFPMMPFSVETLSLCCQVWMLLKHIVIVLTARYDVSNKSVRLISRHLFHLNYFLTVTTCRMNSNTTFIFLYYYHHIIVTVIISHISVCPDEQKQPERETLKSR